MKILSEVLAGLNVVNLVGGFVLGYFFGPKVVGFVKALVNKL